ncbi:MAG: TlpA disulfide reductase family protein [Bacteroidales bacterium]|nr:TlpA disulfide reductase family protein [Bacteroidales bacterium]
MKKLFLFSMVTALIISCSSDPRYVVEGELEGMDEGMIYLQKRESGQFVTIDSASVEDGAFEMTGGSVDYPDSYYLSIAGKRGSLMLFLENAKIKVSGHADSLYQARVEGSASQDDYNRYNSGLEPFYEKNQSLFEEIRAARQEGDEEKAKGLEEERNFLYEQINDYNIEFIESNPASYATPMILRSISYDLSGDQLQAHVEKLDTKLLETKVIIDLKDRIEKLRKVAIGEIAPDFTQNDTEGNPVSLSDIIGTELLLVDFWAAWCGPCRQENPNVLAVYNEFHDKGFDVLGVSLDRERDDWLKAIEDDSLTWTHVSDLKFWENEAAQLYAVNAIPANYLLDSEGRIIATNVRGPELRKKVAEILGE